MDYYGPKNVYNMDNTGILFKYLPTYIYGAKQDRKSACGTKVMKAKDRATIYIKKIHTEPIRLHSAWLAGRIIIGTLSSTHPSFVIISRESYGQIPKNTKWRKDFLDHVCKNNNYKVHLIMDNCSPYGTTLIDTADQAKVVFILPNVKFVLPTH